MSEVRPAAGVRFDLGVETLIAGAGAAGLVAGLAAAEAGQEALILERDAAPAGSTALSAGLVPAAGTAEQRRHGVEDSALRFAADIQRKAGGENDPALVAALAAGAGPAVEWLAGAHDLPFTLVGDFDYPGHSRRRMHGLPARSGRELVDRLARAAEAAGVLVAADRQVTALFARGRHVAGVEARLPDGTVERIGCGRLILACNGFAGNPEMVRRYLPGIEGALAFGHPGNRGDAIRWGAALGAATRHLGAFQGHGNVAAPHGILVTWAVITAGGVQVNARGERFWDESQGYSEAARAVLAQPGGVAWAVFDGRIAAIAGQFADFRDAAAAGAVREAESVAALAHALGLPPDPLAAALAAIPGDGGADRFGRRFAGPPLAPPFCGVRVTGALFHTQGGLVTDAGARVLDPAGRRFPNLFAAGGAACGVSGSADRGYLSGNGLLAAVVLGRAAGAGSGGEEHTRG